MAQSRRDLLMDQGTVGDYSFNPYGMYSLRYLNREYNGDVIRGYRNSDGNTRGFTPAEIADGTLLAWGTAVSGTDYVRVKTWYDQSGNGNDATQTYQYYMPLIMNSSGVIITENGVPSIWFDGSNDFIPLNSALPNIRIGHCSSFCVGKFDATALNPQEMMLSLGWTNANARWFCPSGYSSKFNFGYASTWNINQATSADTDLHLFGGIAGSTQGNYQPFIDGASQGSYTRHVRNSAGTYGIGGGSSATAYALDGSISEVLVFDGDCSTTRAAIEKNIMDYYAIS